MHIIGFLFIFGLGIVAGTQASLFVQGIALVFYIMYMNSKKVKRMEIGALIPLAMGIIFFVGIIAGDISYMFQTDSITRMNFDNPFVVQR